MVITHSMLLNSVKSIRYVDSALIYLKTQVGTNLPIKINDSMYLLDIKYWETNEIYHLS